MDITLGNTRENADKGDILLSEPFLSDPNFERTVILVCDVNEDGHVGFVLNKPIEDLVVSDLVQDFEGVEMQVYTGGPVERNILQFVHTLGDQLEGSIEIQPGLYWGGDFEQLKVLLEIGSVTEKDIRFFVGYSGWGAGQLTEELKANSWLVTDRKGIDIFSDDPETLWKKVMRNMGGKYKMMSNFPVDPRLN